MYPSSAVRRAPNPTDVPERLADVARRLLRDGRHNPAMKQFLRDVARGRYLFRSLSTMIAASSTCPDPASSVALAETVRALVLQGQAAPGLSVSEALEAETHANCRENVAEFRFFQGARSEPRRLELITALTGQLEASRLAIDALHRAGPQQSLTLVP